MSCDHRQLSHFKPLVVFAVSFLLLPIGFLSHNAQAQPPSFTIADIQYSGTGCPQNSVAVDVAPDLRAFTLGFDQYVATIPGDPTQPPIRADRKNCLVILNVEYDPGWRFAIFTVNYEGGTLLQNENVVAHQTSTYRFQGQTVRARFISEWRGPRDEDFFFTDEVDAPVFSPCGELRALQINTMIRVNNFAGLPTDTGLIAQDSIDGELTEEYTITWERCP